MFEALAGLGALAFFIFLILLIIAFIRKKSKKTYVIGIVVSLIILMIVGYVNDSPEDNSVDVAFNQNEESTEKPKEELLPTQTLTPESTTEPTIELSQEPTSSPEPTPEPTEIPKKEDITYKSVLDEYSQKLKETTPKLIDEYNGEAAINNNGIEGLAQISYDKIAKLAEISYEGVEKMATIMYTKGSGKYSEYEEWAGKLNDVYLEEAAKITEAYMNSYLN